MRALFTLLAASALLATTANAATIVPADAPHATAQQMDEIAGAYKLSDGRRADIYTLDNRLYIRIGQGRQKELLMTGANRFATAGGEIAVQLRQERNLDADRIVLDYAPALGEGPRVRLASIDRPGRGGAN